MFHAPNRIVKYLKHKLQNNLKRQKPLNSIGVFNSAISLTHRTSKQKENLQVYRIFKQLSASLN